MHSSGTGDRGYPDDHQSEAACSMPAPDILLDAQVPTLFHTIVNMMAVPHSGIIPLSSRELETAASDALYGILINGNHRLIYSADPKDLGLELVDIVPLDNCLDIS